MSEGSILELPAEGWRNKGKTGDRPSCGCGSWKKHWIKFSGEPWPAQCSVAGCKLQATEGAHIVRVGNDTPDDEYIVPACYSHNNDHDAEFDLKHNIVLVPANKQKTCG